MEQSAHLLSSYQLLHTFEIDSIDTGSGDVYLLGTDDFLDKYRSVSGARNV